MLQQVHSLYYVSLFSHAISINFCRHVLNLTTTVINIQHILLWPQGLVMNYFYPSTDNSKKKHKLQATKTICHDVYMWVPHVWFDWSKKKMTANLNMNVQMTRWLLPVPVDLKTKTLWPFLVAAITSFVMFVVF